MLPDTNCADSARELAERQSNYLILSTLEQKLPSELFKQILTEGRMNLPSRLSWSGNKSESSFADLKMAQGHLNSGFLASLLHAVGDLQKRDAQKGSRGPQKNNLKTLLNKTNERQKLKKTNLLAKIHQRPCQLTANLCHSIELAAFTQFKRMKTVFCHADHSTDEVSSIFNVQFDRTGRFIISGADDGIIKVWDRDTLCLQASLHGHFDFITDIDISKCNRFIASAGKDAQVIIWDLKMGRIVKRLTSHQNLINRLIFVAPRVPSSSQASHQADLTATSKSLVQTFQNSASDATQGVETTEFGPVNSFVKDQFLLTCSDDGTVHLYDFSPFSRLQDSQSSNQRASSSQQRSDYEELRTRRSGRRSAAEQNQISQSGRNQDNGVDPAEEVFIFDVALTPDDYRPGTRNKKIDAVACSSAGIVVAGTSTGELFCWKLNFTEIARKNKAECYRYLGQFKVCKNAGVQFAEFSPTSDYMMTGSTDGLVKIWRIDIPGNKSGQQQALKSFSLQDDSRLVVTIDEKNGCIKTNSISYFDEEGTERFEYQPVPQPVSGYTRTGKDALKFSKSQCDAIKWSVRGRFAIASITSQVDKGDGGGNRAADQEFNEEVCRIKIWDSVNETFFDDLARPCGHQLKKNSWVLAPHPIFEELLMTGSDGGTLILWNLETKQIIKRFSQYGVYSIDGYVRDNPLDGKFSADGKAFIVGNQLGTISLFSCEPIEHQYEATRVQQFFMYDRARNSQNVFENIENRPQICSYNMIPHESQPGKHLIGKFASDDIVPGKEPNQAIVPITGVAQADAPMEETKTTPADLLEATKAKSKAFERKLLTANELGSLEEKYYQHQLQNCLQESYQPNVLEQGNQLDAFVESSIEDINNGRIESNYIEEQSLVNALSPQRNNVSTTRNNRNNNEFSTPASQNMRQRAHRNQSGQRRAVGADAQRGQRRLVRRSDRNSLRDMPVINGYESDELMVDGYVQSGSASYSENSLVGEESASDASDLESSPEVIRQRFTVRRENIHEQQRQQRQEHENEQRQLRADRMARRAGGGRGDQESNDQGGRSLRRRVTINEEDNDFVDSINFDQDEDAMPRRRGRGRPTNAERVRRHNIDQNGALPSQATTGVSRRRIISDEIDSQQDASRSRQTRTRLHQADARQATVSSGRRAHGNNSSSPDIVVPNTGRNARHARRIVDSSNSRMDDHEENKGGVAGGDLQQKTHNQIIRESGYFLSDREEVSAYNFDNMVDHEDSAEKIQKAMTQPDQPGTQPDEDYILVENQTPETSKAVQICAFCQKADQPLVGPFCKYEDTEQTKIVGLPLMFHQDCIEMNQVSKFCIERKKWVNIGKALQNLVHSQQFSCYRCNTKGATVQCQSCSKAFHGFKCARMYTLQLQDDQDLTFYQCVFCRNNQNWEDRASEISEKVAEKQEMERDGLIHEKSYLRQLKTIDKEHLLYEKGYAQQMADSSTIDRTFNPQLQDFVFYCFQGHENYMSQYSLHFYCGQLEKFPKHRFMPWYKHPKIKKREFVRCRIENIECLFPSQRSLNLIEMYGETCTQVFQSAQIIQRCTLVVVEQNQSNSINANPIKFQVDIFPNALPDFLVPQAVFTERYERYVKALETGIVDKTFKVFLKEHNAVRTMRIINASSPIEPSLYPTSLWRNIKCVDANPGRSGLGRVTEMPQHRSTRSHQLAASDVSEDDCERVSFWDIQFGGADEIKAIAKNMHVFVPDEKAKLVNTLKDFFEKKREYVDCFMERVPVEIAPDYRCVIPTEMYFNLIKDRINNCYYRSQEQLLSDIDLISYNAKIYNGENHDISLNAKELCEIIRVKLKQSMFTKSDTLMQQQMAEVGKLTVPSRTRSSLQQRSAIDELRHNLHQPVAPQLSMMGMQEPQTTPTRTQQPPKETTPAPLQTQNQTMQITTTTNQEVVPAKNQQHTSGSRETRQAKATPVTNGKCHEEEKKQAPPNIVKINVSSSDSAQPQPSKDSNPFRISDDKQSAQESKPVRKASVGNGAQSAKSGSAVPNNNAAAANNGSQSVAKSAGTEKQQQQNSTVAAGDVTGAQSRQSNNNNINISRKRKRTSANLQSVDEMEEKTTKTEAAVSVQIDASVTENEEQAGVASTKRVTRNRNKRQRQD